MSFYVFILACLSFSVAFGALCAFFLAGPCARRTRADFGFSWSGFACLAAALTIAASSDEFWLQLLSGALYLFLLITGGALYLLREFYRRSGRKFHPEDVGTLMQTDSAEAYDFLKSYMLGKGVLVRLGIGAVVFTTVYAVLLLNGWAHPAVVYVERTQPGVSLFFASVCVALLVSGLILLTRVGICREFAGTALQYRRNIRKFLQSVREIEKHGAGAAVKNGNGELYVIVVGESQSRDHMHAYTGVLENTPWLDSVKNSRGWRLFGNAYSSHTQTVFCLPQAFTDGRSLTGMTFPNCRNILTTSRLAGMRTAWISNQSDLGRFSTAVTALAHLAGRRVFTEKFSDSRNLFQTAPPDEVLLPFIADELDQGARSGENQLLIVHLMGNHIPYLGRLPEDFNCRVWRGARHLGKAAGNKRLYEQFSHYACSIQYTDSVLAAIAALVEKQQGRPACLLYFSDHGDDVSAEGAPHDYANFTWPMGRIPMFLWTSEEYEALYPERCQTLEDNKGRLFTNDLIYDLYLGLAGIKADSYQEQYDISSPAYALNAGNAVLAWGQKVAEDPQLNIPDNVAFTGQPMLGAHRCNSLFKLRQAQRYGIRSFEVDLLYSGTETRDDLFVGHDPQTLAGGLCLEEYLEWLGPDFDFLWLDIKNLNQENVDEVFARLYRMDRKYSLRSRALVEGSFGSALGIFAKNGWSTALFMTTDELSRLAAGPDAAKIGGYFAGILQQLKAYGLEGVSYDLALDHLVRGFLLPFLPQGCKCNAWRHAWKYTDADLISKIKHYPHLSRLLVALDTLFDL